MLPKFYNLIVTYGRRNPSNLAVWTNSLERAANTIRIGKREFASPIILNESRCNVCKGTLEQKSIAETASSNTRTQISRWAPYEGVCQYMYISYTLIIFF